MGRPMASVAAFIMLAGVPGICRAATGFLSLPGPAGQPARFVADLGAMRCAVLPDGLAFVLTASGVEATTAQGPAGILPAPLSAVQVGDTSTTTRCVVRLDFVGADPRAVPRGRSPLPGPVNVYLGRDRGRWYPDGRRFAEIAYEDLWPGVDLVVRPGDGSLVYELVCDDPGLLRQAGMSLRGGRPLEAKDGGTGVSTELGDLLVSPGLGQAALGRVWCVARPGKSGGAAGTWGARVTTMASEVLWSTYLGGSGGDELRALAADGDGRIFITGFTYSLDYPVTPGAFQMEKAPDEDAVLTAMDSATGFPLWSTYLGGDSLDEGWSLTVLPDGHLIAGGRTWSTDFPTTPGVIDSTREAVQAGYVAELEAATGRLIWCTLLDGAFVKAAAATMDGALVIAGDSYYGELPTTVGAYDESFNGGGEDAFLARISDQGRNLDWCTYLGSSEIDRIYAVALDDSDQPVVAGFTCGGTSPAFPTTSRAFDATYNGGDEDGFASKLSADGHALVWSTFLGGANNDWLTDLALADDGDVVVSGYTASDRFPTTSGCYQPFLHGIMDGILCTLSSNGSMLLCSTYLGGEGQDHIIGVSLTPAGTIVVSGGTSGPTFPGPLSRDQYTVHMDNGTSDAFVAELNSTENVLVNSFVVGGTDHEQVVYNCGTPQQTVVVAGTTWSEDFPVTAGCYDGTGGPASDIFVLNIGSFITPVFLSAFGVTRLESGALVHWTIGSGSSASSVCLWREAESGSREALVRWEELGSGETRYLDRSAPQTTVSYWLQVAGDGEDHWYGPIRLAAAALPERLGITSSAPNPFNPRTSIRYSLPQATRVALAIYDQRGRLVRTLVDAALPAGEQSVEWDGRDAHGALSASGTYIVRLVTEQGVRAMKVSLAK